MIQNYKQSMKKQLVWGPRYLLQFYAHTGLDKDSIRHAPENGSLALEYNASELRVFDLHIIQREGAEQDYTKEEIEQAKNHFEDLEGIRYKEDI